jgi:hypothetical protein
VAVDGEGVGRHSGVDCAVLVIVPDRVPGLCSAYPWGRRSG